MRQILNFSILVLMVAHCALAQPKIGSIVNTANYLTPPQDSNKKPIGKPVIAQGSIFVIFGDAIGPSSIAYPPGLPLPTSVPDASGTSVAISSGGTKFDAFIVYTSALQVGAILPSNTPIGDATVTLTYNGKTSAGFDISVAESRLGIFTSNQQGTGPAAAQHGADSSPVLLSKAAHPGETVVLYGTGLGAITTPDNVAPGAVTVGKDVIVTIAGEVVKPDYAGRSPNFAGLDQVNFVIPANVVTGCYVPLSVTASGQVSQDFVLPIAKSGDDACTHIFGLSESALARLDSGGTVNLGLFQILSGFAPGLGGAVEGAGGLFDQANATSVFNIYDLIPVAYGAVIYPAPLNKCVVIDQVITAGGFDVPAFSKIGGTELIPNSITLGIDGPGGTSKLLRQDNGGYLGVFLSKILGAGSWTISGTGGPDVGPFSAKITLPDDLLWTNAGNFSSVPHSDLTIVWQGGTTAANPIVTVFGNSTIVNPTDPSKSRGKSFYCAAPASAAKFVVPANIRNQLPSASSGEVAFGTLGITTGGFASFTAPLTKGTLDAGVIDYGEAYVLSINY